jgi:asparagine synthase (glutamine-hydrolysing)
MCGISGVFNLKNTEVRNLKNIVQVMSDLQKHRGPDGEGMWCHKSKVLGFGHRRLSIIDLSTGTQPMKNSKQNVIVFNGEIYNYIELKNELKGFYRFKTKSDTEVVLAAYEKWGRECIHHFRGMFSFALWDEDKHQLFCARDRFGIKPFYYLSSNGIFYFASEAKALIPFVNKIKTNYSTLKQYFVFQLPLGEQTLFEDIKQLLPGHSLIIKKGSIKIDKYWDVLYKHDLEHTQIYFQNKLREILNDSISLHLRSDVPVGVYLSGGLDSGIISVLARKTQPKGIFKAFNGRFDLGSEYDESNYASEIAKANNLRLSVIDISSNDFIKNIEKVIYHLDYPVAGPGSFPLYMVSKAASKHLKVILGGQGGDEIFGGYVRYLIAYFEQCIKGAIEGTSKSTHFIVTYESIIPNLVALKTYIPTLKEFWSEGLFDERDRRYFRLINRGNTLKDEINWNTFEPYSAFNDFKKIFWGDNVLEKSYFDSMTNFDFKTLLPALLQVEDRMGMAHGLESRIPFLDHALVELIATVPSIIKFEGGNLKKSLTSTFSDILPQSVINRKDKMGFPVPLNMWAKNELKEFLQDTFNSQKAKQREYLNPNFDISTLLTSNLGYNRKLWGLLSLELWQKQFHDKQTHYTNLLKKLS